MKDGDYFQEVGYIDITAEKLYDDFIKDEIKASVMYREKALAVSGTVESILLDSIGNVIVTLVSMNGGIKCKMFEGGRQTVGMEIAGKVTILGICMDIHDGCPQMGNCTVR